MIKRGNSPARLELIKKVASLSVEGLTTSEIAKELNVTYSKVRRLLSASENLPMGCLSETAQVARLLDLDRSDGILRGFLPLATGKQNWFEAGCNQDQIKENFEACVEAVYIVLEVIKLRAKLLRYGGD
jgi:hypothetical protein